VLEEDDFVILLALDRDEAIALGASFLHQSSLLRNFFAIIIHFLGASIS